MDGVVVDSEGLHEEAWAWLAQEDNIPIDVKAFLRRNFGRKNRGILEEFYGKGLSDEDAARAALRKEGRFRQIYAESDGRLIAGLVPFVEELARRGVRLAVGSSAPRANIEVVLERAGLAERFPVVIAGEDVGHSKPHPEVFSRCCEALGLPPADCVVLEDSLFGIQAAEAAGCRCVGFATTHPAEKIEPLCAATVRDFKELHRLWFGA